MIITFKAFTDLLHMDPNCFPSPIWRRLRGNTYKVLQERESRSFQWRLWNTVLLSARFRRCGCQNFPVTVGYGLDRNLSPPPTLTEHWSPQWLSSFFFACIPPINSHHLCVLPKSRLFRALCGTLFTIKNHNHYSPLGHWSTDSFSLAQILILKVSAILLRIEST